jgi:maltose alpha-D-glucosyltransferase / alpha-amylase
MLGSTDRTAMALSLMLSMPGAPTIVYGDEIGMGEDLSQHDRTSVRTPMQWSAKRNGGFSTGKVADLIQPMVDTGPFAFKAVNVEDQLADPGSLLNQIKRIIRVRRGIAALLRGRPVRVTSSAKEVHARAVGDGIETILLVHNLSPKRQKATLRFDSHIVLDFEDLLDGDGCGGTGDVELELPPYGYRWLRGRKSVTDA